MSGFGRGVGRGASERSSRGVARRVPCEGCGVGENRVRLECALSGGHGDHSGARSHHGWGRRSGCIRRVALTRVGDVGASAQARLASNFTFVPLRLERMAPKLMR